MSANYCFFLDNELNNGGFELGMSWTIDAGAPSIIIYAHTANDGSRVLEMANDTVHKSFSIEMNKTYKVRYYIKFLSTAAMEDLNWYLSITKGVGGDEFYRLDYSTWASPQLEGYYLDTMTLPAPDSTETFVITLQGPSVGTVYFDSISICLYENGSCEWATEQFQTVPASLTFSTYEGGPAPEGIRIKIGGACLAYTPELGCVSACNGYWSITAISSVRITASLMSYTGIDCNNPVNMPVISYDTTGLAVGEYTDTITIQNDSDDTIQVPVTCQITPDAGTDPIDIPCLFVST